MSDTPNWSTGYASTFGYFTFYNNKMYFPNNNSIIETNLDDGTHIVWVSTDGTCNSCIVYGDYLYSTHYNSGNVFKISLADKSIETFINLGGNSAQSIVEYGGFFYISNYDGGKISKIKISDPYGPESNLDWAFTSTYGTSPLAITSEYLYVGFDFTNYQYICRIKLSDGSVNLTWAQLPSGFPDGLLIHNGYLYATNAYTTEATNTIYRITLTDTPVITVWKTGIIKQTYGISYNDNYIYVFSGSSAQTIGKYYLASNPTPNPEPPCFKEDTEILTDQGYKLIQDLRKGDLIKTLRNDFKPIAMIGKRQMQHNMVEERVKTQLYKCSPAEYPEITKDLVITGCHSILVDAFVSEEQKAKTIEVNGKIYVTDIKYRLPACADERASVYEIPGEYTIYHLALEHEDYYMNYGIYANGLLVETCSKRYLKELSNMDLIE
jgi:hypothetical protein